MGVAVSYTREEIDQARRDLEETAARGGCPWLRWTDEEVIAHLDQWKPAWDLARVVGQQMGRHIDEVIMKAIR